MSVSLLLFWGILALLVYNDIIKTENPIYSQLIQEIKRRILEDYNTGNENSGMMSTAIHPTAKAVGFLADLS